MQVYLIHIGKVFADNEEIWHSNILKLERSIFKSRELIDLPVSEGHYIKESFIPVMLREAASLDFTNDEVLFSPTMERILSLEDLRITLERIVQ